MYTSREQPGGASDEAVVDASVESMLSAGGNRSSTLVAEDVARLLLPELIEEADIKKVIEDSELDDHLREVRRKSGIGKRYLCFSFHSTCSHISRQVFTFALLDENEKKRIAGARTAPLNFMENHKRRTPMLNH